jgi:hypothetical protein
MMSFSTKIISIGQQQVHLSQAGRERHRQKENHRLSASYHRVILFESKRVATETERLRDDAGCEYAVIIQLSTKRARCSKRAG